MRFPRSICIALASACLLTSCEDDQARAKITQLEEYNRALSERLKKRDEALSQYIAEQYKSVTDRLKHDDNRLFLLGDRVFNSQENDLYVTLDPSESGYLPIKTTTGTFLMRNKPFEPYMDGFTIPIEIGNPYVALYSGFKLQIKYGKRPPKTPTNENNSEDPLKVIKDYNTKMTEWKQTLKTKDISFPNELAVGSWTGVNVILAPATIEELGYMAIKMNTDAVQLRKVEK